MKIAVVGIGMVGAPIARFFAEERGCERGADLFLYDIDPRKGYSDDINRADIIFISVPTPAAPGGRANIDAVSSVVSMVRGEKIVVIKSTVPPGTTEYFQKKHPQHKILFNPEFLTEKRAWEDFIKPDRQIVGFTEQSVDAAHAVLSLLPRAPFMSPWGVNTYRPVKITATEAEIIKYGGNAYFSRKVTFANALAMLAQSHGAEYENIRLGMAADYRIGDSHLDVGHGGYRGFGGYCFPKDLNALMAHMRERGAHAGAELLRQDWDFNEKLLASQGLTVEEVSVHDAEWIEKKLKSQSSNVKTATQS